MGILLVAVLALASAAAANVPAGPVADRPESACPQTSLQFARKAGEPVKPHRLTELADANMYVAVYRHIGRCEVPIVVEYGVGKR